MPGKIQFKNNGSEGSSMLQKANDLYDLSQKSGFDANPYMDAIRQSIQRKDDTGFKANINALNEKYNNDLAGKMDASDIAASIDMVKHSGLGTEQAESISRALRIAPTEQRKAIMSQVASMSGEVNKLNQQESITQAKENRIRDNDVKNYEANAKIFYDKLQALTPSDIQQLTGAGYFLSGGDKLPIKESARNALARYQAVVNGSKLMGIHQDKSAGMGARITNAALSAAAGNLVPFKPGMSAEDFAKSKDEAAAVVKDVYAPGAYDKYRKDNGLPPSGGIEDPNSPTSVTPQAPSNPISGFSAGLQSIMAKQSQPVAQPSAQPIAQPIPQSQQPQQVQQPQANQNNDTANPAYAGSLNYYQPQPIQAQ